MDDGVFLLSFPSTRLYLSSKPHWYVVEGEKRYVIHRHSSRPWGRPSFLTLFISLTSKLFWPLFHTFILYWKQIVFSYLNSHDSRVYFTFDWIFYVLKEVIKNQRYYVRTLFDHQLKKVSTLKRTFTSFFSWFGRLLKRPFTKITFYLTFDLCHSGPSLPSRSEY